MSGSRIIKTDDSRKWLLLEWSLNTLFSLLYLTLTLTFVILLYFEADAEWPHATSRLCLIVWCIWKVISWHPGGSHLTGTNKHHPPRFSCCIFRQSSVAPLIKRSQSKCYLQMTLPELWQVRARKEDGWNLDLKSVTRGKRTEGSLQQHMPPEKTAEGQNWGLSLRVHSKPPQMCQRDFCIHCLSSGV